MPQKDTSTQNNFEISRDEQVASENMSRGDVDTQVLDNNSQPKPLTSFDKLMNTAPDYSHIEPLNGKSVLKGAVFALLTAVVSAVVALLGSLLHRAGASSIIPYGLIMAFLLVFCAAYLVRYYAMRTFNSAVFPRFLMLIYFAAHSFIVYQLSYFWATGTIIIISFKSPISDSFIFNYAGHVWFYGSMLVIVLCMLLPGKVFRGRQKSTIDTLPENVLQ